MLQEIWSWLSGIILAILLAFMLVYAFGMKTTVIGISMENTLYNGQSILVNRLSYLLTEPKQGDIVVFYPNGNRNTHYYVKRVVAVPGDSVLINQGKLYVNGRVTDYHYDKIADPGIAENELTLGEDEFFVLGDNCNNSEDSRSGNIGPVNKELIAGRAWFHYSSEYEGIGVLF